MEQFLQQLTKEKQSMVLATVIEAEQPAQQLVGQKLLFSETAEAGKLLNTPLATEILQHRQRLINANNPQVLTMKTDGVSVLIENYHPIAKLLVLGGGHIAQPLIKMASILQYESTVVDDRPSFANKERFPTAQVVCDNFQRALKGQKIDRGTSVVIVTRGHKHDLECLEYVLRFNAGYIGMIGSRRRVKLVKEQLIGMGYSAERVNQVYMPIGLNIGAQTPEEIALCIAAQLVAVKRGAIGENMALTSTRQHWQLLEKLIEYRKHQQPVVMATIVRTKGSTPRKAGAKMLVLPDGTCTGTIGGGCGEAEVRREALQLFDYSGAKLHRVMMDAATAAEEGMVCGGLMDVFIERLM